MADDIAGIYSGSMPDKDPYSSINNINKMQQGLIATQQAQTQLDTSKLDLAQKQVGQMHSMLTDMLNDPSAGRSDMSKKISDRLAYGVKLGLYTPAQAVEAIKTVPTDARQQYQWMTTHMSSLMGMQEKLDAVIGKPSSTDAGGGAITTQTPALPTPPGAPPRPVRVQQMQPYGLPPTATEVVPSGPNRGASSPIGEPGIPLPQVPGAPQGMPPQPASGTSARPTTQPAPAAAAPTFNQRITGQAAPPPQQPGGRIMSSLPPGTKEAMEGSANSYNHASEAAGAYPYRINPLRQAIPILEKMKTTDIGPLTDRINNLRSAAQSLGAGPLLGIDPEKIKDFNELKKYFSQYSAQASAVLGPKTNEGLATAVTSNPNVHMDKLSATELAKVALGVERMRQAGVLTFNELKQAGRVQPGDFNDFMLDWGTKQDPRAFVYDLMDKRGREAVRRLPSSEQHKIHDAMTIADKFGLLGDVHRGE